MDTLRINGHFSSISLISLDGVIWFDDPESPQ